MARARQSVSWLKGKNQMGTQDEPPSSKRIIRDDKVLSKDPPGAGESHVLCVGAECLQTSGASLDAGARRTSDGDDGESHPHLREEVLVRPSRRTAPGRSRALYPRPH